MNKAVRNVQPFFMSIIYEFVLRKIYEKVSMAVS